MFTYAQMNARTHARTRTHTFTYALTHSYSLTYAHIRTNADEHMHTHTFNDHSYKPRGQAK